MKNNTRCTVPISAASLSAALADVQVASDAGADCLELRLDYLDDLSVTLAQALITQVREIAMDVPLIVTCRDPREGAGQVYDRELRLQVLVAAIQAGASFIDVEAVNYRVPEVREVLDEALERTQGCRLIISAHDFEGCFEDLAGLYDDIKRLNDRAVPKLVYTPGHINDCFMAFDLLLQTEGDRIVICMGAAGAITRILAPMFNCTVTFAALDKGAKTAPGQLTLSQMQTLYRIDAMNASTELYGIIADPVGHSMSPTLHNAGFDQQGMNRVYLPLWVAGGATELNAFLENVQSRPWLNMQGFSVTLPHKQNALAYVQAQGGQVDPLVAQIGATNTLILKDGTWSATNTDYTGAMKAIIDVTGQDKLKGCEVAVVGAGGVSRALVAGLCDAGAQVTVYNRTVTKAEQLAREFGCQAADLDALEQMQASLIVNCTSIGMSPNVDQSPVPASCLHANTVVFDTVYNPLETLLIKQTRQQGGQIISGLDMFVNQAMDQFRLFTGQEGDAELMRKVVLSRLGDR